MTGHLVFSTLHPNDAIGAVPGSSTSANVLRFLDRVSLAHGTP